MNILALIPARGGSKGVPRKNLLPIAGKPMIAYSIDQALRSKHINRVIVSTDDEEIAQVALKYGAEVPFMRPAEYAGDLSLDFEVFYHALKWLKENENYQCELAVHLRPPGPVRKVELIDEAIEKLLSQPEADSLRSVSVPLQSPYKMWNLENGFLKPVAPLKHIPESYCSPRQQLPQVLWQNGYIDIVRSRTILDLKLMCGHKILPFLVEEPPLEIDYLEDIPKVEAALKSMGQHQPSSPKTEGRLPV